MPYDMQMVDARFSGEYYSTTLEYVALGGASHIRRKLVYSNSPMKSILTPERFGRIVIMVQ